MSVAITQRQKADIDEIEAKLRRDLAACYRMIAHLGWDDGIANHISVRLPVEGEVFLINPFGLFFEEVTASCLIKINADGEILQPTPHPINPAGFTIHSAIHMARADAGCVLHLHNTAGVAVSMMEEGLLPLSQQAMVIGPEVTYHEYEGVAVDLGERERLQRDLGDRNLMILRNHGTLSVGRTIGEAFRRIYALERACEAQLAALGTGRPIHFPAPEVVEKTGQFWSHNKKAVSADLQWDAVVRKMERLYPDFAD